MSLSICTDRSGFTSVLKTVQGRAAWEQLKNNGPKLVPFFKTLGMYFAFLIPTERPSVLAMILKCLPIIALGLFILLHGINARKRHSFRRRILVGLAFSCLGDAFLVWPWYFPHGIAAFGVAQLFYMWAFGFKYPHWSVGAIIYGFNTLALAVLVPSMAKTNVPLPVIVGLPLYSMLLMTTVWRGIARAESLGQWNWTKMCSCVGGILFAVSDSLIGISLFLINVPYSQILIMSTYYVAQLCIALSIVNTEAVGKQEDESDDSKAPISQTEFEFVNGAKKSSGKSQ